MKLYRNRKGLTTVGVIWAVVISIISVAALSVSGSATSLLASRYKETPPETAIGSAGSISGCGIPDEYSNVFTAATEAYPVSPALVAAIFYAGEHGKSWPDINSEWASSPAGASGPFQFTSPTWRQYGEGDFDNAQDIDKSAKAAAHLLYDNYKASHGDEEKKIRDAIKRYNPNSVNPHSRKAYDPTYIDRVYDQYIEFLECVTVPDTPGDSSQVPIDGHVFPLEYTSGFGGDWLANRCSGTGSGTNHAHGGTDIMHKKDDKVPVYAIVDGYIYSKQSGSLRLVSTNPNDSHTYYYTHLSRVIVGKGAQVQAGQLIGYSGGYNGGAQGNHTHLGMLTNPQSRVEVPISSCRVNQSARAGIAQREGLVNPIPLLKELRPE